jgi:hypothetical protein
LGESSEGDFRRHATFCTVQVVWDIMRCWAQSQQVSIREPDSFQAKILSVEPKLKASFSKVGGAFSKAKAKGEARFVQNPENWGPRPRHGRPMLKHEREEAQEAASNSQPAKKKNKSVD